MLTLCPPPPCLQLQLDKLKGEILGVVVVESGWGSILPTVILANMMNGGPAARSGKLSIGDQIMSINGTSLVGLPLATCQGIIKVWHHREGGKIGGQMDGWLDRQKGRRLRRRICGWTDRMGGRMDE